MARFLTPHFRVICPDLPGFGDAGRDPQAGYTMVAHDTAIFKSYQATGDMPLLLRS
jgi:pimeloyl-ACP methyl ester carboxylesterase